MKRIIPFRCPCPNSAPGAGPVSGREPRSPVSDTIRPVVLSLTLSVW